MQYGEGMVQLVVHARKQLNCFWPVILMKTAFVEKALKEWLPKLKKFDSFARKEKVPPEEDGKAKRNTEDTAAKSQKRWLYVDYFKNSLVIPLVLRTAQHCMHLWRILEAQNLGFNSWLPCCSQQHLANIRLAFLVNCCSALCFWPSFIWKVNLKLTVKRIPIEEYISVNWLLLVNQTTWSWWTSPMFGITLSNKRTRTGTFLILFFVFGEFNRHGRYI